MHLSLTHLSRQSLVGIPGQADRAHQLPCLPAQSARLEGLPLGVRTPKTASPWKTQFPHDLNSYLNRENARTPLLLCHGRL